MRSVQLCNTGYYIFCEKEAKHYLIVTEENKISIIGYCEDHYENYRHLLTHNFFNGSYRAISKSRVEKSIVML